MQSGILGASHLGGGVAHALIDAQLPPTHAREYLR